MSLVCLIINVIAIKLTQYYVRYIIGSYFHLTDSSTEPPPAVSLMVALITVSAVFLKQVCKSVEFEIICFSGANVSLTCHVLRHLKTSRLEKTSPFLSAL